MGTGSALTTYPATASAGRTSRPAADRAGVPAGVAGVVWGLDVLDGVLGRLRDLNTAAPGATALLGFAEAAAFASGVEDVSRILEHLQITAANAVNRSRLAAPDASPAADDEYRKTGDFLRARLRISAGEATRRLALAGTILPRTGFTGEPLPPLHEELAAAAAAGDIASRAATLISQALARVRPLCDPDTTARMEHALTTTATDHDHDFLARIARRWTDAIDQDGTEPSEEALHHRQGAFIHHPRNGLHHLEIFATTDQYEHLITVMNTATNPRTTTTATTAAGAGGSASGDRADGDGASGDGAKGDGASGDGANGVGAGTAAAGETADTDWIIRDRLDPRTRPQKLLDGLIGACKAALTTGGLPTAGGLRPQVMVTIDYRDLLDRLHQTSTGSSQTGFTGTGTMAFTGPISAGTIRKIACDADIIPLVLGSEGQILDIGRAARLFPPHLRKALTARDQGCAFPDCTIPAPWCEAHHITYWSHGGTTGTNNGTLLCSHHHHVIHKEQWTIHVQNGIPWFIPPPHLDPAQQPRRNPYFRS